MNLSTDLAFSLLPPMQILRADRMISASPSFISNNDLATVRSDTSDVVDVPISFAPQISYRACAASSAEAMDVQRSVFILYHRIHAVDLIKRKISATLDVSAGVFLPCSDVEKNCVLVFWLYI